MSPRSDTERGYLATRWHRLNGPQRIGGVDLARGLAVLGMFAAHLLVLPDMVDVGEPDTWLAIVNGRSSILFATLAGVSIGLVTGGSAPLTGSARTTTSLRLGVRAFALWVLGILLIYTGVPVYVILPAYAVLFLLAIPLSLLGARALLLLAAGLALTMPFVQVVLDAAPLWSTVAGNDLALAVGWHYPFTTWVCFVLAGLGVARLGITRLGVQWALVGVGAGLATAAYGLDAAARADGPGGPGTYWSELWTAEPHSTGLLEVVGSGGFALAALGLALLACRTPLRHVLLPLRAVGAMPLTAYTLQLAVWAVVAAAVLGGTGDLSGFRELDPFWPLTLATVGLCTLWALLLGRGPLEELLDRIARALVRDPGPMSAAHEGGPRR